MTVKMMMKKVIILMFDHDNAQKSSTTMTLWSKFASFKYYYLVKNGPNQGKFWGYLGDILGISWMYLGGETLGISWGYLGDILGKPWGYLWDILGIYWVYLGCILGVYWGYLG